jgi:hypothetical protein
MNDSNLSLDHRLNELRTVAAELRAEREQTASKAEPSAVRSAAGRAFIRLGAALLGPAETSSALYRQLRLSVR